MVVDFVLTDIVIDDFNNFALNFSLKFLYLFSLIISSTSIKFVFFSIISSFFRVLRLVETE